MANPRKPVADALRGCRVLIVEDEMLVALELEGLLDQQGCIVLGPAPSLDSALALLDREQPDVALLDFNLNGQAVTPLAKALAARRVPFILATGYGAAQLQEPAVRDAPRVTKPVRHSEVLDALAQALAT